MSKERIDEIDIIKALGIICMVAGHSGAPFTKFVYLFHMAIFFICSGFFFKDSSSDNIQNLWKSIRRKMLLLWFPFFMWNTIYTLLNNVFIKINVYTNNGDITKYITGKYIGTHQYLSIKEMINNILKGLLFGGGTTEGGAFWFLKILFFVSVGYCIGDFLVKKLFTRNTLLFQCVASVLFLLVGYYFSIKGITLYGMDKILSYYILYFVGHVLYLYRDRYLNLKRWHYLIILLLSFILLLYLNKIGSIALGGTSYENPVYLLLTSICGWFFLLSISYYIKKSIFKKLFLEIGKRTISVVILHFLAMKIVAYIVCAVYELPYFCVAAHPNVWGNKGLWWLAYTAVGVFVPVLLCVIYEKIKNIAKNSIIKRT